MRIKALTQHDLDKLGTAIQPRNRFIEAVRLIKAGAPAAEIDLGGDSEKHLQLAHNARQAVQQAAKRHKLKIRIHRHGQKILVVAC